MLEHLRNEHKIDEQDLQDPSIDPVEGHAADHRDRDDLDHVHPFTSGPDWDLDNDEDEPEPQRFLVGRSDNPVYFVAEYRVVREYGGPEEGGWYYDSGSLDGEVRVFDNKDDAMDFAVERRLALPSEYERPSILNNYMVGQVRVTTHLPVEYFPVETPHYE